MYFLSMNINLITVGLQLEGSSTGLFYMYGNTYNYVYNPLPIKDFLKVKFQCYAKDVEKAMVFLCTFRQSIYTMVKDYGS